MAFMTCPGAVLMAAPAASAAHGNGCNPPQLPLPQVARRLAFVPARSSLRVTHPAVARPVNAAGRRCVRRLRVRVHALPRGLHSPSLRCSGRRASPRAQFARLVRARLVLAAWFSVLSSRCSVRARCKVPGACSVHTSCLLPRLRCSGRRASPRAQFARSVRARLVLAAWFSVLNDEHLGAQ